MSGRLVNWKADFVETRNFDNSTARVAVHIVVTEVGHNLAQHDYIFEAASNEKRVEY